MVTRLRGDTAHRRPRPDRPVHARTEPARERSGAGHRCGSGIPALARHVVGHDRGATGRTLRNRVWPPGRSRPRAGRRARHWNAGDAGRGADSGSELRQRGVARGGRTARERRSLSYVVRAGRRNLRPWVDVPCGTGSESQVTDLLSLLPAESQATLIEWLTARGEPAYRLRQILPRLWQRPVARWSDASDLPASLRAALEAEFPLPRLPLVARPGSAEGTEKYLWRLSDGEAIESVLIPEGK